VVRPRRRAATVRLSVLQSFATLWLLPRLAAVKAARLDIEVELETSSELVDLDDGRFDAAIRFGTGRWPGLCAERLIDAKAFAVAAPGLLPVAARASAALLDRTTLLGIAQAPDLWPQYLAGIGLGAYRPRRTQTFDNVQLTFAAAANGLGLALGTRELVAGELSSGRLVEAFRHAPVPMRQSYHFVYAKERQAEPALRALRQALVGEAARDADRRVR
jgi:LysR family glycine cleavage system transcriptional activator